MKAITVSGTLFALNNSPVPPMRIEGDPSICAQLFIQQVLPPHLMNDGSTYVFRAKVYHRSSENFFLQASINSFGEPEAVNAVHFSFVPADLHRCVAHEFARLLRDSDSVILTDFQLTVETPPVVRGEAVMTSERKSPPLTVWDMNRVMRKHAEFQEAALRHIGAGSPRRGINDSFMTRCALIGLRDAINDVLEKA